MKRLSVSILTLLLLVLFFNGCKKNTALEFQKVDHIRFMLSAQDNDSSKGYCKVDIQFLYPSKGDDEIVLKKIQQQLLVYAFDSSYIDYPVKAAIDTFIKTTFDSYSKHIIDKQVFAENSTNEEWRMNTVIIFNDNGLLSYELSRSSQIGKVYRSEYTQYLVFDLHTGNKIAQRDIFEEGVEPVISDLLKKQIMLEKGFDTEEHMINNGYFFAMNIVPNENFSVSDKGISYLFNSDEIAVYSLGQTEVFLPFSKLAPYLKKESPIAHLFAK